MSEPFDIETARTYANRRLQPDDSYHADAVLAACDEIERLRADLYAVWDNPRLPCSEQWADEIADKYGFSDAPSAPPR